MAIFSDHPASRNPSAKGLIFDVAIVVFMTANLMFRFGRQREDRMFHRSHVALRGCIEDGAHEKPRVVQVLVESGRLFRLPFADATSSFAGVVACLRVEVVQMPAAPTSTT